MKKILVPIDFSTNSLNALKYAIELVNMFNAELHIVHSFYTINKLGMAVTIPNKLIDDSKQDLEDLVEKYQSKITSAKKIKYHFLQIDPPKGIAYAAKKYKADMIVMGTKGASGLKGAVWGSVASRLLTLTKVPILAVPKYYTNSGIKHVLFAISDPSYNERDELKSLVTFKEKYKAKVTTFNMIESVYVDALSDEVVFNKSDLIKEISDEYFQSFDKDLKQSIIKYTMDHNVDMICMVRKNQGFLKDLLHASSTKKVIFDTPVPLLVLQGS